MRLWMAVFAVGCGSAPATKDTGPAVDTDDRVVQGPSETPDQVASSAVCLNELMAVNDYALVLEDGTSPDWVELHNPSEIAVSLDGWALDNEADGRSSPLDGLVVEPEDFLLLYASEGAQSGPEHLAFNLSSDGGSVFLKAPDGGGERMVFGRLEDDHSVARDTDCCTEPDCLAHRYRGTPGESNRE